MIILHQEVEDATASLAAEAVKNPLLIVHRERGSFLPVKGTQPDMITADLF